MSLRPLIAVALASVALPAWAQKADVLTPAQKAIHESFIVLDTHFDTPALFSRPGWDMLERHSVDVDGSQVDYPRMVEGGVDGGVFTIFTGQGPRTAEGFARARDAGIVRAMDIHEMVARNHKQFSLALTADDAEAAVKAKKRFVIMSIENSYPLGKDITLMQTFQKLGVRIISPVHTTNNDWADSATDAKGPEWGGLSPLGKAFVAEANRLGMVIDGSHASDLSLDQMIALSKTPLILSHTGSRAIFNHPRNIDDDRMRALAAKGGVIQLNAFSGYMIARAPRDPAYTAAMADLAKKYPDRRAQATIVAYTAERRAIEAKWPAPRANLDDFMKHLIHAIEVAGIDHVGISGDFDGGGGIDGLNEINDYPKITGRLLAAGYSREDIGKFWGGNALRVMRAAQAAASK